MDAADNEAVHGIIMQLLTTEGFRLRSGYMKFLVVLVAITLSGWNDLPQDAYAVGLEWNAPVQDTDHDLPDLSGAYEIVAGINPSGSRYAGVVTITKQNEDSYCLKWDIASSTQEERGCGRFNIDSGGKAVVLSVDWGAAYPVIYEVSTDGKVLTGTWNNGAGKENLKRQ